jgi:acetyl esterase
MLRQDKGLSRGGAFPSSHSLPRLLCYARFVDRSRLEIAVARTVLSLPAGVLRILVGAPKTSPDGLRLDLQTQALLALSKASRQPDVADLGVRGARKYLDRMGPAFDAVATDVAVRETTVPCATEARRVRVYAPHSVGPTSPGLVFFHGGGFVAGSIDSHDRGCRAIASKARVVVVSVDYRLAPEHIFPAAVEDAVAATRWVLANAATFGVDPGATAVGGDSAGGTLAAVVAQTLRTDVLRPAFQLLIYPVTDANGGTPSREYFREDYFLTGRAIAWYLTNYIPDKSQYNDPRASPLLARDLSGLPPALVITAGFDPLRDEGRAYAAKLQAAGGDVTHVCSEGSMHGFFNSSGLVRESARMLDLAAAHLKKALVSRRVASAA